MPRYYIETIRTYAVFRRWAVTAANEADAHAIVDNAEATIEDTWEELDAEDFTFGKVLELDDAEKLDEGVIDLDEWETEEV